MRAEIRINGRETRVKLDENAVLVAVQFNDGVKTVQIHGNGFQADVKPGMSITQYDLSEDGYTLKFVCLDSDDRSIAYDPLYANLCVCEYHTKGVDLRVFV